MPAPVDWTDPCARAATLSNAYYALLSGQQEQVVRTRSGESEDEVRFAAANLDALRSEMQAAQAECAALTGTPNRRRRFAIQAGSSPYRGAGW